MDEKNADNLEGFRCDSLRGQFVLLRKESLHFLLGSGKRAMFGANFVNNQRTFLERTFGSVPVDGFEQFVYDQSVHADRRFYLENFLRKHFLGVAPMGSILRELRGINKASRDSRMGALERKRYLTRHKARHTRLCFPE